MEISTKHLILGMLAVMATQIDGAKEKREALELAPGGVIVGPPATIIPEGPPPSSCDGSPCGIGGTCEEFCVDRLPAARLKRGIEELVSLQNNCPRGCTCCGEQILQTDIIPVECDGTPCGDGGVCRSKVCSANYGEEIQGECSGDCRCCKEPDIQSSDCVFNGRIYKSGERIEGVCVDMTCRDGQWVSQGYLDECCKHCMVYNDPHFMSYDGLYFDFHGKCNYSITQYGTSYYPPYAVYGDFAYVSPWLSRVDATTFKDNTYTVIKITHAGEENIKVNDVDYTVTPTIQRVMSDVPHPVLAWRVGNCIRFLGTQRLLVEHCWSNFQSYRRLNLYAHPALADQLYGLCGHFNYYAEDDLTHRDGSITPPTYWPNSFGNSWETYDQNRDCWDWHWNASSHGTVERPVKKRDTHNEDDNPCFGDILEEFLEECREVLSSVNYDGHYATPEQLEIHIMFCARELCALETDGSDFDMDEYLSGVQEMLQQTLRNDVMTTPGARPPITGHCEACNGTCWQNATCRYRCDSTEEEIQEGRCKGEHCKCCKKKPTCGGDCGSGGTCRSCSCQDDEEQIDGACNLKGCLCCKKKLVCEETCRWKKKTYPCVPPTECKRIIKSRKCSGTGCACCKRRK